MGSPDFESLKHIERIAVAALQIRIHARHQQRVCADARRNREITPALGAVGLLKENAADSDLHRLGIEQGPHGLDRIAPQPEILRQCVGGSQRYYAQGHLCAHKRLKHFVHCAIAAAGEHRVVSLTHRAKREGLPAAGGVRFQGFSLNTGFA